MPNPQVIWGKKVDLDTGTTLVRAVRTETEDVEFEYFEGKDAMGEGTWRQVERMPAVQIDAAEVVRVAFVKDAATLMAKTPMIQQGD